MKSIEEQFIEMLKQEGATEAIQRKHKCWTFIPSKTEWERMERYTGSLDRCPKCGGRVGLQFYHGNIGEGISVVCQPWSDKGCGFNEFISDDE